MAYRTEAPVPVAAETASKSEAIRRRLRARGIEPDA